MFRVAVCDDNKDFIEYEKGLVCRFLSELTNNYICDTFDSGEAFLLLDKGIDKYDMVILDCKMDNLDGVGTAETIRKYNEKIKILFSTDYYEFSQSACDFEPIGYLLKSSPDFEKLLCRKIRTVYRKKADDDRYVTGFSGGIHRVSIRDVVYINSYDHYLHFFTKTANETNELVDYKKRAKMDDIADLLGDSFVRVNYSYMVNMIYITAIDSNGVTVGLGSRSLCIPIRRGDRALVEERFNKYLGAIEW